MPTAARQLLPLTLPNLYRIFTDSHSPFAQVKVLSLALKYTTSGVYTNKFEAANGCDSTVITTMTVENAIDVTMSVNGNIFSANASGAAYQWMDCKRQCYNYIFSLTCS
jgi:hypothetical protein